MQEPILNPGWDTVFLAAPFVVMLALGIFRLDVVLARPKGEAVSAGRVWGTNRWGEPLLRDPDGPSLGKRQRFGRLPGGIIHSTK